MTSQAQQLQVGQHITAGAGENRDRGTVAEIDGGNVTVQWDSGVVTTQSVAALFPDLKCVVNDIDGAAFHTVDSGRLADVWQRADDRLRRQIVAALVSGGEEVETFERDGEEFTTRVVVRE